jgi:hypothetical protein
VKQNPHAFVNNDTTAWRKEDDGRHNMRNRYKGVKTRMKRRVKNGGK